MLSDGLFWIRLGNQEQNGWTQTSLKGDGKTPEVPKPVMHENRRCICAPSQDRSKAASQRFPGSQDDTGNSVFPVPCGVTQT